MPPTRCPCLSGLTYDECCGHLHRGQARAETAEAVMRARFSAFALHDVDYLSRTWHHSTRPPSLTLDADLTWYRLDVLATSGGGIKDAKGTVEFRAYFRSATGPGAQHEESRFVREGADWVYLDGIA